VTADTYGLSMITKEAELKVPEARQEIETLLIELEESR